jgi:hypothetical protein
MGVIYTELDEQQARPAVPTKFLVHIRRQDGELSLCNDKWGAYVTADEDEAVPYIIGNVETLCLECRERQFTI